MKGVVRRVDEGGRRDIAGEIKSRSEEIYMRRKKGYR